MSLGIDNKIRAKMPERLELHLKPFQQAYAAECESSSLDRAVKTYDRQAWLDAEKLSTVPFFKSGPGKHPSLNPLIFDREKKAEAQRVADQDFKFFSPEYRAYVEYRQMRGTTNR